MPAKKKKRVTKKKTTKKRTSTPSIGVKTLLESNLLLQHKIADLVISTKELNSNVSELVKIFKQAGDHIKAGKYEDPMINKINNLLEQNQNLAKGLSLLEDYVKSKTQPRQPF
tara:strand:+ start:428 stop:766 length:339 start_codon:yes stop_codon:yes gene_type:complete